MRIFAQNEPLTDAEFDRLGEFLKGCAGGKAMNVEELDGFFAALVAGPEIVMPSEYLPEVFGGEMSDTHEFGSLEEANDILALLMRHWNDIAATLSKGDVYLPILLEDENGVSHGNDWARGFMRGVDMCHDGWAELVADEEHGGCMVPVLMLYHEHDPDPEMRPEPIGAEQREKVIEHMAAGPSRSVSVFPAARAFRLGHPRNGASEHQEQDWAERPVSVRLWEEVQALLRRPDDKLNPGWFHKKLGDRWLHGRLCRLPETPRRDKCGHADKDFAALER